MSNLLELLNDVRNLTGYQVTEGRWDNIVAEVRKEMRRWREPVMPDASDEVAVAESSGKTAALVYDKVWSPPLIDDGPPPSIVCYGATEPEVLLQSSLFAIQLLEEHAQGPRLAVSAGQQSDQTSQDPWSERFVVEALARISVKATAIYTSRERRKEEYRAGSAEAVVGLLENVGIVDEDRLTWDQVIEFRSDPDAREGYRRFIHWLDSEMIHRDVAFVREEILIRLEHYEAALRKHGIATVVGVIESLMDPGFVASTSVLFAGLAATNGLASAGIASILLTGAKLTCSIARSLIDRRSSLNDQFGAISFVHELKKLTS